MQTWWKDGTGRKWYVNPNLKDEVWDRFRIDLAKPHLYESPWHYQRLLNEILYFVCEPDIGRKEFFKQRNGWHGAKAVDALKTHTDQASDQETILRQ